jgi:hypothetical protein
MECHAAAVVSENVHATRQSAAIRRSSALVAGLFAQQCDLICINHPRDASHIIILKLPAGRNG